MIDTYHQESAEGANTWTNPLKVDREPWRPLYGAFSRNGTFEGDYGACASLGAPARSGLPKAGRVVFVHWKTLAWMLD